MAPALVVLAAGMARRYGGCKPLAPIGPERRGGHRPAGQRRGGRRFRTDRAGPAPRDAARPSATTSSGAGPTSVDVAFAEQRLPLGTVHAVLAAQGALGTDRPFAVANADDVYGEAAMGLLARATGLAPDEHVLIGYRAALHRGHRRPGDPGHLRGGRATATWWP